MTDAHAAAIFRRLDAIDAALFDLHKHIKHQGGAMLQSIQDLKDSVAALTTSVTAESALVDSGIAALKGVSQLYVDSVQNASDLAEARANVQAVKVAVDAKAGELAAAIPTNTPVAAAVAAGRTVLPPGPFTP